MICVSLALPTLEECLAALDEGRFAEIRLDKTRFKPDEIRRLFSSPAVLIATCRPGAVSNETRAEALLTAISSGAAYVDIEVDAPSRFREKILEAARKKKCRIIISCHNFAETPATSVLARLIKKCFSRGADIAKVACRVKNTQDCVRLLSLYKTQKKVIALGLGELGVITRIAAPFLGAPFTYASLSPGKETAKGQLDIKTLETVFRILKNGKA